MLMGRKQRLFFIDNRSHDAVCKAQGGAEGMVSERGNNGEKACGMAAEEEIREIPYRARSPGNSRL